MQGLHQPQHATPPAPAAVSTSWSWSRSDADMLQLPRQIPATTGIGRRTEIPTSHHVCFKPPEDRCSGEKSQCQPPPTPSPCLGFVI